MQIWLSDKDRCSMLFLGGNLNFTYDEPGPIDVNILDLTLEQKTQLYYNWKRGVLAVDDENQLKSTCEPPAPPPKTYAIANDAQPVTQPKDVDEALKARTIRLRGILREKIPVIKKRLVSLSGVELLELLDLERGSKNRQKLTSIIQEVITKNNKAVSKSVGIHDVGKSIFNPNAQNLDNFMDVVDSEMEDVTLIPSDKELIQADG